MNRIARCVRHGLALSLIGLLSTACAPSWVKPPELQAGTEQNRLLALTYWRLEGRVAIQAHGEGVNANLYWEHDGRQDRVRLSGPFSQGAVSVVLQDDLIYLNEGNGNIRSSRDPEELLQDRLGFSVPLRELRYWVLGLPSPRGAPAYVSVAGAAGEVRSFSQQGYSLTYERFARVKEFDLPQKLSAQGGELKLKLIVDEWVLN